MADHPAWHGHRLNVLPPGESWLTGGQRRPEQGRPVIWENDPWPFEGPDGLEARAQAAPSGVQGAGGTRSGPKSQRGVALLVLLTLAAIATIFLARPSGSKSEPAPLPEPSGAVITQVSRTTPASAEVHIGEYLRFALPAGRSYSTIIEQPAGAATSPVLEALTLPGQQPGLRADSAGHAVVQVMTEPTCTQPDGCPDQRTLLGSVDVTVTP